MMVFKRFGLFMGRAEKLTVFCQHVMETKTTPALIRLVAGKSAYIQYCRQITHADETYRKRFAAFCREKGFNPAEIRMRIYLPAMALGLCKQVDYYGILGVSPDADAVTIKQAYRRKAHRLHPDKVKGEERNSDAFVELHAAYAHLSDPGLRKAYEETRRCTDYWIEGDNVPAPPGQGSGGGRFIVWMVGLLGGMFIVAFTFGVYQRLSSDSFLSQPSGAELQENAASDMAGLTYKIAMSETVKPVTEQKEDDCWTKADDGAAVENRSSFLPPVKPGTLSTTSKNAGAAKTANTHRGNPFKKAVPVKAVAQRVKKSKPCLAVSRMVPEPANAPTPKNHARRLSGATRAGAKKVSQLSDTEKKIGAGTLDLRQKQRVLSFLQNYTKTYEEKNLERFRLFFANGALEQGRPFKTLLSTYQRTFARVEALQYNIEPTLVSKDKEGNIIHVEGNFTTRYRLPEHKWGSCIGLIRMELLDEPEGLVVSRLDYQVER